MANLPTPAGDELSYNGFTFDATTSSELTVTPVEDRAKRTHTHYVHELTARMKIAQGNGAVAALARAALSQPAGVLVYRGRGVGVHRIGGPRGAPDLMWGPKPGPVRLKPLGGPHGVELSWSVRWATMTCADAVFTAQPMEFCYSVDYDVDYAGLTTRRYSAVLRIPQSRRGPGDRVVQATADAFREAATPPLPPGFRRTTPASARISEDKCECVLTCVDEEFGNNVYPPGVVAADASYSIESVAGSHELSWTGRLSATYEVAKGTSVAPAFNAFFSLLQDRVKRIRANPGVLVTGGASAIAVGVIGAAPAPPTPPPAAPANFFKALATFLAPAATLGAEIGAALASSRKPFATNKAPCIIPWSISFTEPELYGRNKVQITAQFRVVGVDRDFMLANSGLWRAVPGASWRRWVASVAIHQGPRGYAQLILDPGSDAIQDLCRPGAAVAPPEELGDAELRPITAAELRNGRPPAKRAGPKPPKPLQVLTGAAVGVRQGVSQVGAGAVTKFFDEVAWPVGAIADGVAGAGRLALRRTPLSAIFPAPTAESSWLDYACAARVENDSGVVIGKTLPTAPLPAPGAPAPAFTSASATLAAAAAGSTGAVFAQQRTVPTTYVVLSGYGIRAGFPVPRPALVGVGSSVPVPCSRPDRGEGFEQVIVGNCGVALHYARWQLRYAVVGQVPVGGSLVPDNGVLT